MNWCELLVGAVLGCLMAPVFTLLSRALHRYFLRIFRAMMADSLRKPTLNVVGRAKDGFLSYTTSDNVQLNLLTKNEWLVSLPLDPTALDGVISIVPIDVQDIAQSSGGGSSSLYDGSICNVLSLPEHGCFTGWKVRSARYYEYAKFRGHIMAAQHLPLLFRHGKTKKWLEDPVGMFSSNSVPIAVGGSVALVHRHKGCREVLIHVRSSAVFVEPGMWSVLPTFGIESNLRKGFTSTIGLLQHNFLRELGEEVFGIPEVVRQDGHFDPDWFLEHSDIAMTMQDWKTGRFSLRIVGAFIDIWNPSVHFAMVAISDEECFWNRYLSRGKTSWEIGTSVDGGPIMEFVPLRGAVREYKGRRMTESSQFVLDRINKVLGNAE